MTLPTSQDLLRAAIAALVLALLSFLLYPLFAKSNPQWLLTLTVALTTFIAALGMRFSWQLPALGGAGDSTATVFIGNLAFRTSQEELRELFEPFGPVHSLRIMKDRVTRRPRGFAFVELDSRQASKAIRKLNEQEFNGRTLRVNESNKPSAKE